MVLLILLLSTTTLSAMNTQDHLGSIAQDCINKLSQASDDLSKVCDDIFHINTKENQKTNVLNIFKAYIDNAHIIIAKIQNAHPYDLQDHLKDAVFF